MTDFNITVRKSKRRMFVVWLVLISLCGLLPSEVLAANAILNIRHWVAPDHTRIVIDTREKTRYQIEKKGQVLSLYFRNCEVQESIPASILLNKRGIEKILHESVGSNRQKVDFFLDEKVKTTVFNLKKVEDKPYRIVIDIEFPDVEKKEIEERAEAREQRRDRIIVIDPGHGGDDPGAIGQGGTYEKSVVLDISRKLKSFLNQQSGYRAYLTREGDYYVPFKKRLKIAREYGAAMFISVHADAAANREARGSSVYCLSLGGASTAAARILANKENLADMVGGSPNGDSSEASDPIVLNMCQTNTLNMSKNFGNMLLNSLDRVGPVKFRTVQEAQLRVLKLPEIPSVLVETAYISNAEEEEWLKDSVFQSRMAETIGKAILEFEPSAPLTPSPSPAIMVRNKRDAAAGKKAMALATAPNAKKSLDKTKAANPPQVLYHRVKRGETLQQIALRYEMPLTDLAQLNAIKISAPLPAGKRLKIAKLVTSGTLDDEAKAEKKNSGFSKKSEQEEQGNTFHKVQKGETLATIAHRYRTSPSKLLKLNGRTWKEPLYAGTTIKVKGDGDGDGDRAPDSESGKGSARVAKNRTILHQVASSTTSYQVHRGDSLDSIAREHHITVAELRKLNDMKNGDPLLAGTKIKIPETAAAAESKEGRTLTPAEATGVRKKKSDHITYRVKRGDTLDTIARKHKTPIDVLLSLNKMKLNDPLYANQSLKLPKESSFF
ncbi:MAG: N-acetylmuramoyl-L-alanine amidase AmiC precursor [Syntrophus sp. PtaU1.Bin208]|nr:MAG: N-acetylmuramoyl-L-alanine amidase AmiC precursor [Syntrophus sp. PtaU1.Bin208]